MRCGVADVVIVAAGETPGMHLWLEESLMCD